MKTQTISPTHGTAGNALIITMMLSLAAFITVAGIMSWSAGSARLTSRSNQYSRSIAAAEAATEKVMSQLNSDFLNGGEALVSNNLAAYKQLVPTSTDSAYWTNYQFSDAKGHLNRTYVNATSVSQYTVLTQPYAGLFGYVSTYDIVSDASETGGLQTVTAGVLEEVQLTRIPIFQFSMYSSDDMEISCGQPFTIDGRVHSNGALYVEPDNVLTFNSLVSSVGQIYFAREPADPRGDPAGSVVYLNGTKTNDVVLTLPIGMTNTSAAIQQIIQPPPAGEDPNSPLGRLRYYNQVDMIITVTATTITATSGRATGFVSVPNNTNQLLKFVSTNSAFQDIRENKKVLPLDIDIGKFTTWCGTNTNIRNTLGNRNVMSIYVFDTRASVLSGGFYTLPAVRVKNGTSLPSPLGLTIATARPMYVWGNYNQSIPGQLYRTNTSIGTQPASLVCDALTILSPAWVDSNSLLGTIIGALTGRQAINDTVNAAIIAGSVYTTSAAYSGGMENFPRFLEDWGDATLWYNGSMVKMFASVYATNAWGADDSYQPPTRSYYFDQNFTDPTKLPPLTPSLQTISRNRWSTLAANQVTATNTPW